MSDRISSIHLKQFIGRLIEDESTKAEVLSLVDKYIGTVQSDKRDLVDGIEQLLNSPEDGRVNAKDLVNRFGKMPDIVFSNAKILKQEMNAIVITNLADLNLHLGIPILMKVYNKGGYSDKGTKAIGEYHGTLEVIGTKICLRENTGEVRWFVDSSVSRYSKYIERIQIYPQQENPSDE